MNDRVSSLLQDVKGSIIKKRDWLDDAPSVSHFHSIDISYMEQYPVRRPMV